MVFAEKLLSVIFGGVEGDVLSLVSAPDVLRQGNDDAHAGVLHRSAMREHGIILLFVGLIPHDVPLRRKKRRQEAADVSDSASRLAKTHLGKVLV